MSQIKEKLYNPIVIVIISVTFSVSAYLLIASFTKIPDFKIGLMLSTVIPIAVSLPISVVMIGYLKKIQKQKIKMERLDSTNKKLFSLLSHDIRSPITSLKGIVDLLTEGVLDKKEGKIYLGELSKKIDNVLEFLDDLLLWSKRQVEKKPIKHSLFNCNEIIKSTIDLLEDTRKRKNIRLEIGEINNTIYTDKDIYAFVFRNIYHNAIKFTPEHGKIEIYTEIKNKNNLTVIKDSGIGISQEDIKNVLNEDKWFTQNGTFNETGTGFGISTCVNYLKQNNGKLLMESEPGKGTKVSIVLPHKHQ